MGNLSKQYNPVEYQTREPVIPKAGSKQLDSIESKSGNPHWKSGVYELEEADIKEAYEAAQTYITNIMTELKRVYDSLCRVNNLEPLIEFNGKTENVDARFDEIIERLNSIYNDVTACIDKNLDDIDAAAQKYVNNKTESCRYVSDIREKTYDENGEETITKTGEIHYCPTHGSQEYKPAEKCPYCGK